MHRYTPGTPRGTPPSLKNNIDKDNKSSRIGQRACPTGATCLPIMGTLLAPVGQN